MDHAYVTVIPACDLCGQQAFADAKTIHGPWANLCRPCWEIHSVGRLGTGYGQEYLLKEPKP